MKRFFRKFRYGETGFTLIELLVVVAILGVLAAVAIPNIGKFIGKGKTESRNTELHNVQTGVMAMMADGQATALTNTGTLVSVNGGSYVVDMSSVTATSYNTTVLHLNAYLTGLGDSPSTAATETNATRSGAAYTFASDGTVTQHN